ncbi:MAG: type II toxin-antitoxin system VapC family toxin [Rhodospirillales bacterium]|nr:type II toxin-antitoxin system VapC family toxin [Rhodospirillales bacterium]
MTILDASAVLALLLDEPGAEAVSAAIAEGARMSAVNFAEVATRYVRAGATETDLRALRDGLPVTLVATDAELAIRAALFSRITREAGLSLGDRMCLALAQRDGLPVLTADRAWVGVAERLGVTVRTIR